MTLLQLKDVSLRSSIGSHYILQAISSQVAQGDRIALVGASGAGKTSLLRLLNRLSEMSAGAIYFQGREIREIPVLTLRRQITLVLQESRLLGMTVRQALAYPLKLQNLSSSLIHQRLTTWSEALHLPSDWLDSTEAHLSVGQRQLVAIARALMLQPEVLLLDEPTSALDAGRSSRLLQVLQAASANGMAVLMVNHQLDMAQQFCNRVWYLHQGSLLQDCPVEQVNWEEMRHSLVEAEMAEAEEWA